MILSALFMLIAVGVGAYQALSRPRAFPLFLLPMSLFAFGAETEGLGGLANLSAVWLLCLIVLCLLAAVGLLRGPRITPSAAEVGYILFLLWCAFESVRAAHLDYALRAFLRLLFPLLSMYVARRAIGADIPAAVHLLRNQFRATASAAAVHWGMLLLPAVIGFVHQLWWFGAVFFDHAAVLTMLALASWKIRRDRRAALLAVVLIALCFRAVNRTTMIALAVGGSTFCLLEYRRLSIVLLPALYFAAGAVLLLVPAFRAKMFYEPDQVGGAVSLLGAGDRGTADAAQKQFNSNGRFEMWGRVLATFYRPNPALGSGLGATQAWFYTGGAREAGCGNLRVEHSEYVRMLCDVGFIGLGLFGFAALASLIGAARALRRARAVRNDVAATFAVAGICSVPVFLVCMAFDNALLYVLPVAQFPFALGAIASGLAAAPPVPIAAARSGRSGAAASRVFWLPRRLPGMRLDGLQTPTTSMVSSAPTVSAARIAR
jgi:hypothetical protein